MRRGWRLSVLPWILLLPLVAGRVAGADWDFTAPGDPNRSWGVSVSTGGTYDDNFFATERNRQTGYRSTTDIKLRASVPLERLFVGAQYDYGVVYPHDINLGGVDQTHSVGLTANYTVNPRLTLSLSETFLSTISPGLVLNQNNVPVTISNFGGYMYDAVGGGVNYAITPRWTAAVSGNWDIWQYRNTNQASIYDHEDYSATISALYALDTRTTAGINYQYSQDVYVNPGPNNGLNGYGNTAYLSVTRRFNPRLSLTLNGGYTIRKSEDGSENGSPSGAGILMYNYSTDSTISLTIAQSLTESSVGVNRTFSAQENTSLALQINHRLTPRLRASANLTYTYSSFTAPLAGTTVTLKPNEQALTSHIGLSYAFRDWLSATVDYYYADLASSSTFISPYTRNQVTVGITLAY